MLNLPGDIDEHCFGGMFCELVGLTDVHLAAVPRKPFSRKDSICTLHTR